MKFENEKFEAVNESYHVISVITTDSPETEHGIETKNESEIKHCYLMSIF